MKLEKVAMTDEPSILLESWLSLRENARSKYLSQLTCVVALIVQCNDTCATTALCLSLSVYRGFHSLSEQFKKLISFPLLYPTIVERNQHRMTTDDKR